MVVAAFENISSLRGLENALQDNLRETIARRLEADPSKSGEIVRLLLGVADDLEADRK